MNTYKNTIASNLINGNYSLSPAQQRAHDSISAAIDYAWNNWDADILATYYVGEKPETANTAFITNWIENEDLEADGYNVDLLEEIFA